MATIVAAHDLSGIGRCSLVAAISILSSMGHHVCPLPTALLSKQTAFAGYSYLDFTPYMQTYLDGWESETFSPDAIYTGFLGDSKQTALLQKYIIRHPQALVVVDPVMGDLGTLYGCFEPSYVDYMRQLVQCAHIITPNQTEFSLLTGHPAEQPLPCSKVKLFALAQTLKAPQLRLVVVTGVSIEHQVFNYMIDLQTETVSISPVSHTGISYSGTGDLFSSILCGCIALGSPPKSAVKTASDFIKTAAAATPSSQDPRYGVCYEPFLSLLSPNKLGLECVL